MSVKNYVHERLNELGLELKYFDSEKATGTEWQALNTFHNHGKLEMSPEDPPTPLQDTINGLKSIPEFVVSKYWIVWRGEEAIAGVSYEFLKAEENRHLLEFDIYILPEFRRQGIGKLLLQIIVDSAESHKRRLLLGNTDSSILAGEAFMQRLGAEMGLAVDENRLVTGEVDGDLMQRWVTKAQERAGDLELVLWTGPYPEDQLEKIAAMLQVMNTAPTDDLDIEDVKFTPEQLRQTDETLAARNIERWTMLVCDPQNGAFAGYTQLYWKATVPHKIYQGDTGVFPEYRGRGIGRWLKAAMMQKALAERPDVKYIDTGNASSNQAMLKINHEMGFRLHKTWKNWQIETNKVKEYMDT